MSETFDMLITGGTLVNHDGVGLGDVGVRDGKIVAIGDLSRADAGERVDATGLHVLPGVIDTQVHFREPGPTHKEDLESGSRAAALGGVIGVFEMPNTSPTTSSVEALEHKLSLAKGRMHCDHAFYAGATNDNADVLPDLERLPGCAGVKVFMGASTGSLLVADDEGVARVLAAISRRAAFHCEDEMRLNDRKKLAVAGDWSSHPVVRDARAALLATQRLIRLAREAGKRVHVLHVSTAEEMVFLQAHKDIATVEVTPQHLTLRAPDCYEQMKGRAQMNPPIRTNDHRTALWSALRLGLVDVIGSDHAPHTLEEKAKPYPASPSGMPGVQSLVPIMLDHVNKGRLSLQRFVDLTSAGPKRIFGLAGKGRMAIGYDADFTLADMKATRKITDADSASKSGWTPFDGRSVTGWPMATIIRGQGVMRDGALENTGRGKPIYFEEALAEK
ncbi:MAG: dihydroorotase [Robiginitomaculum sp.]|nr:MAG: dihydroorotase [Robiginitomaculum sp.]